MIVRKRDWNRLNNRIAHVEAEQRIADRRTASHWDISSIYGNPYVKRFNDHLKWHRAQAHAIQMSTQAMRPEDV